MRCALRRNRHFRMAYSCKAGSAGRVLWPTARYATGPDCCQSAAQVLLSCAISNVDASAVLLRVRACPHRLPRPRKR